tara:strand:- start:31 stop:339 length:309 start_codon:yes stop_codon:yes gene_type:complete
LVHFPNLNHFWVFVNDLLDFCLEFYIDLIMTEQYPFRDWLESKPRGTAADVARRLEVSREYIRQIANHEVRVSHDRAKELSAVTGLKITTFPYWRKVKSDPR